MSDVMPPDPAAYQERCEPLSRLTRAMGALRSLRMRLVRQQAAVEGPQPWEPGSCRDPYIPADAIPPPEMTSAS